LEIERMELFVLIGQRRENYPGEYGMEALACATEYDMDGNPDYLPEEKEKYEASDEFEALAIATLNVDETALKAILFPEAKPIPAEVVPA
jgi:hypothetical protein